MGKTTTKPAVKVAAKPAAKSSKKKKSAESPEAAEATNIVADFCTAFLVKKGGSVLTLGSIRRLLATVLTGKEINKHSPQVANAITAVFPDMDKLAVREVEMMQKDGTLPATYRVEVKRGKVQDTKLVGVTLKPKMPLAWAEEGHKKNPLYQRVLAALAPAYKEVEMNNVYTAVQQEEDTTTKNVMQHFPVVTPLPGAANVHVVMLEGLLTRVEFSVTGLQVSLTCLRVVHEGSTIPSGTYTATYFLPRSPADGEPITCEQVEGQLALWKVTVPLEQPRATVTGSGQANTSTVGRYKDLLGIDLAQPEVPDTEEEAPPSIPQAITVEEDDMDTL